MADTAIKTADSGYLTRRLVDVAQDVIVREFDCGTEEGIVVRAITEISGDQESVIEPLWERLAGRVSLEAVVHPETGEILIDEQEMIDDDTAKRIEDSGVKEVKIRSVLACNTRYGVCVQCYGRNLANGSLVDVGEAVGIVAAQSIGEPGTQLTMRTFHTGGVAGDDITAGLPRVEELFEARKPKGQAIISEIAGTVSIVENKGVRKAVVQGEDGEEKNYTIPYGARLRVRDGDVIAAGDRITEGPVNPHDILAVQGTLAVQEYLVQEVQEVYRSQGVNINDKHIEVIVRQMLRKLKIEDSGDTLMLPGSLVDVFEFQEENRKVEETVANLPRPNRCSWVLPKRRWPQTVSCLQLPSRRPPGCSRMLPLGTYRQAARSEGERDYRQVDSRRYRFGRYRDVGIEVEGQEELTESELDEVEFELAST